MNKLFKSYIDIFIHFLENNSQKSIFRFYLNQNFPLIFYKARVKERRELAECQRLHVLPYVVLKNMHLLARIPPSQEATPRFPSEERHEARRVVLPSRDLGAAEIAGVLFRSNPGH